MVKILFFHFRVTSSNLKNIKLHFELLIQAQLILKKFISTSALYHMRIIKRKLFYFFGNLLKKYLYIIISYYYQPLLSKLNNTLVTDG